MEAFYDLSPLVALYSFIPASPPIRVCTRMHIRVHVHTDTHQESQGAIGICQVLRSSQLNSHRSETKSILMQGLFFLGFKYV